MDSGFGGSNDAGCVQSVGNKLTLPLYSQVNSDETTVAMLCKLREKQSLSEQELKYQSELLGHNVRKAGEGAAVNKTSDVLHANLSTLRMKRSINEMLAQKQQLADTLLDCFYPKSFSAPVEDTEETNHLLTARQNRIKDFCKLQTEISAEIAANINEHDDFNERLNSLQQERLKLKQLNRDAMDLVSQNKSNRSTKLTKIEHNARTSELLQSISDVENKVSVMRILLQNLFSGSSVNWAEDPAVMKFLFSLSNSLDVEIENL